MTGGVAVPDVFNVPDANTQGIPYDYNSVTHIGKYAFSKKGLPTFELIDVAPPVHLLVRGSVPLSMIFTSK